MRLLGGAMGVQAETLFQQRIQKEIEKRGGYCVKQHGSMIAAVGIPDLLVCYKGYFIAIEAKVDKNTPSKAQGVNLRKITKAGGFTAVVWTIKDVKTILDYFDSEASWWNNILAGFEDWLINHNIDSGEKW